MKKGLQGLFLLLSIVGMKHCEAKDQAPIVLQFENLFPETPYKRAHKACVALWQGIQEARSTSAASDQLDVFHAKVIDNLLQVHNRIADMLEEKHCAEDREDLAELLHKLHEEYLITVQRRGIESTEDTTRCGAQTICSSVLFDHVKKKLIDPLLKD